MVRGFESPWPLYLFVLKISLFFLGLQLQVVVNNPPNFVNFTQRQRLNQLVSSFEDTEFTMKHNATMFWLNAFDAKIKEDLMERNISEPKTFILFLN